LSSSNFIILYQTKNMVKFQHSGLRLSAFGLCTALLIGIGGCGGGSTSDAGAPSSPTATGSTATSGSSAPSTSAKIDVNKAPIAELDKLELPGTKPSLSERIQGARPYKTAEDLVAKKAISQDELNLIKNLITVGEGK
jgi:DNA uptake protein ComE-like DNA-binding protein